MSSFCQTSVRTQLCMQLATLVLLSIAVASPVAADVIPPDIIPPDVRAFLDRHCVACHEGADAEAGFDLTSLTGRIEQSDTLHRWIRIIDRVHDGEMPPEDANDVPSESRTAFVNAASEWLTARQLQLWQANGRVPARRLTRLQIERTLHDLLGIDIPLIDHLPEEPRTAGFSTVSDGQPMSHFQIQAHLNAVDRALDEAFRRAMEPPDEWTRTLSANQLSRRNPRRRCREPELIDGKAVTWSGTITFYGRLPATTARESGWYRFRLKASALNLPVDRGVWCTVQSGPCVSSAPLLTWVGAFEASGDAREWTFETWLPEGHMLEVRPGDATLKKARFQGGQIGTGEGAPQQVPGVALHEVVMERIHHGPDNRWIRNTLFGDLTAEQLLAEDQSRRQSRGDASAASPGPVSDDPGADIARLIRRFAARAFRRDISEDDAAPYVSLARETFRQGGTLLEALRSGYRAVLCSPRFLYFHEPVGQLDDLAIACRLSYFLWNSMPDAELRQVAASGQLHQPGIIRQQVERMLSDERGRRFLRDFASEWLDLSLIDFTQPDRRMFREFDLIVQNSMLNETHAFLQQMLDDNLSVTRLVHAEETFLNSRLARYYGIEGVRGDHLRPVPLKPEHHRSGGLLTQGSILKVTANGTATSPVLRGVWVSERLLGIEVPPPPTNVPAIEPDIRGARTIREMLARHRSDPDCASCHIRIDPAGFALENFDPTGRWRDRYITMKGRKPVRGATIDASYQLPDGRSFRDITEFRDLIAADPEALAANVVRKLITYGTGAPVTFADREAVSRIVADARERNYGLRTLVSNVAASQIFTTR